MSTLEELKNLWEANNAFVSTPPTYDHVALKKIVTARTNKHLNAAMQYFWGAFVLQIIVYALLGHVMAKYGGDRETLMFCMAGVLLFLPFTIMLMKKFKRMAVTKPEDRATGTSLSNYVFQQHTSLASFYTFKKRYELVLIPLSTAIGIFLTFKLYVPGGVAGHPTGAIMAFVITLLTCAAAIVSENRRNFERPLQQLQELLDEFKEDASTS
jgi:hypothetical protein